MTTTLAEELADLYEEAAAVRGLVNDPRALARRVVRLLEDRGDAAAALDDARALVRTLEAGS